MGGTAAPDDFALTVNGTLVMSDGENFYPENSTLFLDETSLVNYNFTGIAGDNCPLNLDEPFTLGQNTTCTITNTFVPPQSPSLTLKKTVINNNGRTAAASDFELTATGPTGFSGNGTVSSGPNFSAGTYDLSEIGPPGYTASDWVCTGATQNDANTVTITVDDSATCTITNDDTPITTPSLTLKKTVINNNGRTAAASDFELTATGPTGFSGNGTVSSGPNFSAGTYDLSEIGPPGYTASDWVCTGATQNDANTVTITVDDSATCTITNDDTPITTPSLTLKKTVINNNGRTAAASDFELTATGPTGFSGNGTVSSGPNFSAGTYDLSEIGPPGYTASDWVCTGATQNDANTVTITVDDSATCTITNDDTPITTPSLTLKKTVINNNGRTAAASDFELTATGPTGFSGNGTVSSGPNFSAGTYDLSEIGPPGYTASDWVCTGATQNDANTVTITVDDSATCTITNDDTPITTPSLTLKKTVINNNGRTAAASDFELTATGPTGFSGNGTVSSGPNFSAGTYDLSEIGPPGYTASDWVCTGATQNDANTVTITVDDSATCTITNDDTPITTPSLTLKKTVINNNGRTAAASDFELTATGPTGFSGNGTVSSGPNFSAGTYDLSEIGPPGYTASDWVCTGATQNDANTVTITVDDSATCTITNDDTPITTPSLTLKKTVINNNGRTAAASDFELTATGPTGFSGNGTVSSGPNFSAGTYDLSEIGPPGYTASDWVCTGATQNDANTVTITVDDSATCTITNDDTPITTPSLTLKKTVINNNGRTAAASDFELTATGPTGFSGNGTVSSGPNFSAGTYDLSEIGPPGYTASDWVCTGATQK